MWSLLLCLRPAGQAQDYLTRDANTSSVLSAGVDVLGFARWGVGFALLTLAVVGGLLLLHWTGNRWPILIGHVFGAALHVAYVIALVPGIAAAERGWGLLAGPTGAVLAHVLALGLYLGPRERPLS